MVCCCCASGEVDPRPGHNHRCNLGERPAVGGRPHRDRWHRGAHRHPDTRPPHAPTHEGTPGQGEAVSLYIGQHGLTHLGPQCPWMSALHNINSLKQL